jgi:hypothetical protein
MKLIGLSSKKPPIISENLSNKYYRFYPNNEIRDNNSISSPTALLDIVQPQISEEILRVPTNVTASSNTANAINVFSNNNPIGWTSNETFTNNDNRVNQVDGRYSYTQFSDSTVKRDFNISIPNTTLSNSFLYNGNDSTRMMDNTVINGEFIEFTIQPKIYLSKYTLSGTNIKSFLILSKVNDITNRQYGWTILDKHKIATSESDVNNNIFTFNVVSYAKSDMFRIIILELFTNGNFSTARSAYINKLFVYAKATV